MIESPVVLALAGLIFVSGFWAGYAVRDKKSRMRRQRLASAR